MSHRHKVNHNDVNRLPREGTNLRKLYEDLLLADGPIKVYLYKFNASSYVAYLRDFYCCEFKNMTGPNGGVVLVGRWDGPYLVTRDSLLAQMTNPET